MRTTAVVSAATVRTAFAGRTCSRSVRTSCKSPLADCSDSCSLHIGRVAQWLGRRFSAPTIGGSNPSAVRIFCTAVDSHRDIA